MHTLEQLAQQQKDRAIARHQRLIDDLRERTSIEAILAVTTLRFQRDIGAGIEAFRAYRIAIMCAEQLIPRQPAGGVHEVEIGWAAGPHKMHIKARSKADFTSFALVPLQELLEAWDAATRAIDARSKEAV